MGHRIGFVSTRFAGTDGVSLEASKWAVVYEQLGHEVFWFAGLLDRDESCSHLYEPAFFGHEDNLWINDTVFGTNTRTRECTNIINNYADRLKQELYAFVERYNIDYLITENANCIPMHLPLGIGIANFIAETHIPSLGHHHDFFWERERFKRNSISDYLSMAFPPVLPSLQHVTINTLAQRDLAARRGSNSVVVPNVYDFENPPLLDDPYVADMKQDLGFDEDDIIILQPTRVVPRKGIEHAVNLIAQMNIPKAKLVISHHSGDEGNDYRDSLLYLAEQRGVEIRFIDDRVDEFRGTDEQGRKIYGLGDAYLIADLVTYTSLYEGFGNAFLETLYYQVPIVVNRYTAYVEDIEPCGFNCVTMNGFVTQEVVQQTKRLIEDKEYAASVVKHNYQVALKHFSYKELRLKLDYLLQTKSDWHCFVPNS